MAGMKSVLALVILALLSPFAAASAAEPVPTPKPIFFATGSSSGFPEGMQRQFVPVSS
jgi:hypothetical protein